MNKRTANGFALIGTVLLQASAIPAIVQALQHGETAPLSTLIFVALGLACCTITEVYYKLWAYVIGSVVGFTGHVLIIAILLTR